MVQHRTRARRRTRRCCCRAPPRRRLAAAVGEARAAAAASARPAASSSHSPTPPTYSSSSGRSDAKWGRFDRSSTARTTAPPAAPSAQPIRARPALSPRASCRHCACGRRSGVGGQRELRARRVNCAELRARLTQRDRDVLGGVVVVNVAVPLAVDDDLDPRRARERDEHGVERGDAGRDPRGRLHRRAQRRRRHHRAVPRRRRAARRVDLEPRRVEVDPHLDRRLLCRAPPLGAARRRRRRRRRQRPAAGGAHPWSAAPPPLPSASRAARKRARERLEARLEDVVRVVAAHAPERQVGAERRRQRLPERRRQRGAEAADPLASRRRVAREPAVRLEADGARAAPLGRRPQVDHRLGERLVERAAEGGGGGGGGSGGGGGDLVDHAAQREAERGAARDEDVAVVRPARHARRVVAARREPTPLPTPHRGVTPSWPCDVSWSHMWSRKQMPVPIFDGGARLSTHASATTAPEAAVDTVAEVDAIAISSLEVARLVVGAPASSLIAGSETHRRRRCRLAPRRR